MTRLMVIQPYVPAYRVPFFHELRRVLSGMDVKLFLAAGRPEGDMERRGDDRTVGVADEIVAIRQLNVGGRKLLRRRVGPVIHRVQPDLIVVEQAVKNLETYPLLVRQAVGTGARVGMWGQGRTFSTPQGETARRAKDWMTGRCDWFFAYTDEGAEYVAAHGIPADRVTVLNNSIDSDQLRADLAMVTDEAVAMFRGEHGLTLGQTALFMGGVDRTKGIDFLLDTACIVAEAIPGFRLLVAGSGSSEPVVRARQAAGEPIVALGRVDGEAKALALRVAEVMMIPEWVGLVAVDSLVAARPIISTTHASHSPEFAYLRDKRNAFVFDHDIHEYAKGVTSVLEDPKRLAAVQDQARTDSFQYSIDKMAERFAQGVGKWRDSAERDRRQQQ